MVFRDLLAGGSYLSDSPCLMNIISAEIDRTRGRILHSMLVNEVLLDELGSGRPVRPDNDPRQQVQVRQ